MFGQSKWEGYNGMDIRNKKWMNTAVNKKELSYVDLYHLSKWDMIF